MGSSGHVESVHRGVFHHKSVDSGLDDTAVQALVLDASQSTTDNVIDSRVSVRVRVRVRVSCAGPCP